MYKKVILLSCLFGLIGTAQAPKRTLVHTALLTLQLLHAVAQECPESSGSELECYHLINALISYDVRNLATLKHNLEQAHQSCCSRDDAACPAVLNAILADLSHASRDIIPDHLKAEYTRLLLALQQKKMEKMGRDASCRAEQKKSTPPKRGSRRS